MVIRRVRAKARSGTGGRPKKVDPNNVDPSKLSQFEPINQNANGGSLQSIKMQNGDFNANFNHNVNGNNFQQINVMNSFHGQNGNNSASTTDSTNPIDFNFPLFFDGVNKVDPMSTLADMPMPKLIADGDVKHEMNAMQNGMDFVKMERKNTPKVSYHVPFTSTIYRKRSLFEFQTIYNLTK